MFEGFSPAGADFLWGLRLNNDRSWFLPRKEEFRSLIDQPLRGLAVQVQQEMLERFPEEQLNCKVSRIYRDARRLHGHGPYKDHLWFVLTRANERDSVVPCFYFELSPEGYSYGMGTYSTSPLTMAKLRARIDRNPKPIEALAEGLNRQQEFSLEGEQYKRPKGDKGEVLNPWYNRKELVLTSYHGWEGDLFSPALVRRIVDGFAFLMPYYRFLWELVSDPDPR